MNRRSFPLFLLFILILWAFPTSKKYAKADNWRISGDPFVRTPVIRVEYIPCGKGMPEAVVLPLEKSVSSGNCRVSAYGDNTYRVEISEILRDGYIEINGEMKHLIESPSCATLRVTLPGKGKEWTWFSGLDGKRGIHAGEFLTDTVVVRTVLPPDGAFNGKDLAGGGYGDPVGRGTMSYYPLCAVSIDGKGTGLGVDMSLPVIYRLSASSSTGLSAEFDFATSPGTLKFPNKAFFRICSFDFDPEWGMRAALKKYYSIYPDTFSKRVTTEGIWLPFTPLRSIPGWDDFGFAFHETSWGSHDMKAGEKIPNILSDAGTGVLSFQYTEPWDLQLPIRVRNMEYSEFLAGGFLKAEQRGYLDVSTTNDKNGLWQMRRLETPWFTAGWAVSITTNCDPDLQGFNKYDYVMKDEIIPALKMDVDGIYFDSMEWNWHHDLNYREEHFSVTDYPLTFSAATGKPAIWNFSSEFKFMKKIADSMHEQGKLAMGNGHGWNPFAASNLDLFGAELSWYSRDDHNTTALDFKRAISFRKPIVFLLNEGLNDKAFTEAPYSGYEIYFEKMLAYGFFPSFFSVDASSDPYWQDMKKVEIGRPFFKKYIPLIKEIAAAGWEPVTLAKADKPDIRIERFGKGDELYFTVRNNGNEYLPVSITIALKELGITGGFEVSELLSDMPVKAGSATVRLEIPAGRTKVLKIVRYPDKP